jgi:hypothetical protein
MSSPFHAPPCSADIACPIRPLCQAAADYLTISRNDPRACITGREAAGIGELAAYNWLRAQRPQDSA